MAYSLSPWLKPRFFITGTNRPLAGGLMYTYLTGTTTPATTYSTSTGTANTNPIVLNSDGECDLYLDDTVAYRIILKNAAGTTQFDKDPITSASQSSTQSLASIAALRNVSGSATGAIAKTLGYYANGDGGGNDFYWDSTLTTTDNSGSIIKPTAVSGAGRWVQIDKSIFNIRQFGVMPSQTGTVNRTQFNLCTAAAVTAVGSVYVPAGTYDFLANNGTTSGCTIANAANQGLMIYGDGKASVLRREATSTLVDSSSIFRLQTASGNSFSFKDLMFDGNEANCPIDEGQTFAGDGVTVAFNYTSTSQLSASWIVSGVESIQPQVDHTGVSPNWTATFLRAPAVGTTVKLSSIYKYEHCANVAMTGSAGLTESVSFDNVYMTGIIGDGFYMNVQFKRLHINNWISYGRTRRPRADIQFSRIPTISSNLNNITCDALESEPFGTVSTHTWNMNNILCRGALDLAGDTVTANITATNVRQLGTYGVGLPICNLYAVKGFFTNCYFAKISRIQRCFAKFDQCHFQVSEGKVNIDEADYIQVWHDVAGAYIEIKNSTFDVDSGVTTGYYITPSVATSDATRLISIADCRALTALDYFMTTNRMGSVVLDGGSLSGNTAVILISNQPTYACNVDIRNPQKWTGGAIMSLNTMTEVISISLSGFFRPSVIPILANAATTNANVNFYGCLVATGTGTPVGTVKGVQGMIYRVNNAVTGTAVEYRYNPTVLNRFGETGYTVTATL